MKKARIYLPFAINEIKTQLSYKGAFYLFIFISTFSSFVSYFLWSAIYGSSDSATLGGLTRGEMTVYIFMVYVTGSLVSISISEWVSDDVVKGAVAMQLIKPIDYRLSLISRALGQMVYRFAMPAVFIWSGLELYKFGGLGLGFTAVSNIALYLLSCIMSFLIYVLFDFCVGMIAFFTSYVFGLYLVKDALLSFLTGQLIPLSFFPGAVQKIFEFLPFSSMIYTPVMIYLGKYTGQALAWVLLRQAIWVLLLYGLGSFIWKRVTRRLVILGG
jgi:ABC-2 type transport system permease protein